MPAENISITTPDGAADAYVTRPDDGDHPGVLFYIDAFGLRPQTQQMADRIASWGYAVLVPNVFYRSGTAADLAPTADLSVPENREAFIGQAMSRVRGLTQAQSKGDATAYLDALQQQPGVAGDTVGLTGYCMGGRLSFLTAAWDGDRVAASGSFHAGGLVSSQPDSPHLLSGQIAAELVLGHADGDRSMTPGAIKTLEEALDRAGVTYTSEIYTGASHGYTMADTAPYNEQAAEKHFRALQDLLDRCLG